MINFLPIIYVCFLFFSYALRPDFLAALTIVPAWIWPIPGFYFMRISWEFSRTPKKHYFLAASLVLWIFFIVLYIEEFQTISKSFLLEPPPVEKFRSLISEGKALRVISFNSASKNGIFQEVKSYAPDILLLQESPISENLTEPLKEIFGNNPGVCSDGGSSIVTRGRVFQEGLPSPIKNFAVRAKVVFDSGFECNVVSFRLKTPEVRFDYWTLDCWRKQRDNRIFQRNQIKSLLENLGEKIKNQPLIFGGDFNAPQGDAIYFEIAPFLRDSFNEKGIGWGNTINSNFAVLRIDQIWINDYFEPIIAQVQKSKISDHNFLVCDLMIKKKNKIE